MNGSRIFVDTNILLYFLNGDAEVIDLKDHPSEFVYLGCKSDQSNWEDSIDKFGLKGTHYLLSEDQYNEFSEQFNLIGFPRYIVIDKYGIIVDEDAKRPSNEDIKAELLTLVNK